MAMIACKECSKDISTTASTCPHCGAKPAKSGLRWWAWLFIVPVGLFLLMLVIGSLSGPPDEKSMARRSIATCWEDQAKKSNTPDAARLIAGSCELMERRFREKYNASP